MKPATDGWGPDKQGCVSRYPAEQTYLISNSPAHTSNHHNAAPIPESNHLLGNRLCRHENASHVDLHHGVGVLGRVLQGGRLLLDSSGGDEPVHASLGIGDFFDDAVEELRVADIDAAVFDFGAEGAGFGLNAGKVFALSMIIRRMSVYTIIQLDRRDAPAQASGQERRQWHQLPARLRPAQDPDHGQRQRRRQPCPSARTRATDSWCPDTRPKRPGARQDRERSFGAWRQSRC